MSVNDRRRQIMKDCTMGTLEEILANPEATFEDLKPMLRPEGVHNGIMRADPDKCNSCGLCVKNCPFKCWEMGEDKIPKMKSEYICFSCFNCVVACPVDAVSVVQTFSVKDGFFDTDFPPFKLPLDPQDADGNACEWTEVEQVIMNRRSVRNFKQDPVPEPLIRRVLEAGRFAPSGGNHQPWKFVVVTDPQFISELEAACHAVWENLYGMFTNDEQVINLVQTVPAGVFDPRVQYGVGCIARKELAVFFGAPAVIFIGVNRKMANPELHAGVTGQNMNLAAAALGLGFCWSNFGAGVNFIPELLAKLGYEDPWTVQTTACIGYPKFKQRGMVSRHFRPITWFRSGADGPQIET